MTAETTATSIPEGLLLATRQTWHGSTVEKNGPVNVCMSSVMKVQYVDWA